MEKENKPDEKGVEEKTSLFPGMKIPKEVEKLARSMKTAEISRKEQASIESDMRADLCFAMAEKGCSRFQIDGVDYEFERDITEKVKSKKLREED